MSITAIKFPCKMLLIEIIKNHRSENKQPIHAACAEWGAGQKGRRGSREERVPRLVRAGFGSCREKQITYNSKKPKKKKY